MRMPIDFLPLVIKNLIALLKALSDSNIPKPIYVRFHYPGGQHFAPVQSIGCCNGSLLVKSEDGEERAMKATEVSAIDVLADGNRKPLFLLDLNNLSNVYPSKADEQHEADVIDLLVLRQFVKNQYCYSRSSSNRGYAKIAPCTHTEETEIHAEVDSAWRDAA